MKMRWVGVALVWAGVVGLGVVSGQTTAAAKRPMTFQDLMAMKRVSDPQISPSGKWVMFSVMDVSLEKNTKVNHLWVVPLGGGGGAKATTEILTGGQNDGRGGGGGDRGGGDGRDRQVTFGDGESSGRFSPDGKWVSISMKDQIYLAPWDEAAGTVGTAVQLTHVEGGADGAVWSPDSQRLMFVAAVYPECSVRGGAKTNAGVSPLRPSASGRDDASMGGVGSGTGGFEVSGTREASVWKGAEAASWAEEDACDKAKDDTADKSPVKGQVWEGLLYRHWDHWTGAKRSHVLIVSAMEGNEVRDLTPASEVGDAETPTFFLGGLQNYAWAPDSQEIAYVTNLDPVPAASTNNDVFTLRVDEPWAKAVKVSTSLGSDDGPAYSPDGKWLAFRSQARAGFESDKFRLMLFDREKKTTREYRPALLHPAGAHFDGWIDEFVWSGDSDSIFFASGYEGAESVFQFDVFGVMLGVEPKFGRVTLKGEYSDLRLFDSYGVERDGRRALQNTTLVATKMSVDGPSQIVTESLGHIHAVLDYPPMGPGVKMYSAVRDGDTPLTHLNDGLLSQLELHPLESFWFTGAEGTKVEGFIMRPPGFDPAKKYPVKFLMHGGPQTAWGDAWSFRWNWELMASSGYVVVGINRRGSTGYGQKFVDEVSGDWGGRAYEDLMKGLDYAEAHYSFMDKTRECALGASYGGYMADWVLTHTNRFQCIVTHDGMYDPVSAWGDTEEMWFNEWEFRRPEDFPKGWDGFGAGYDPMGHPAKTNAGVSPLRPSAFGRDDASSGGAGAGRDDAGLGDGHPAEPWRYQNLPADQDPFRKWAPMRFIENAKTPTLVIHSQRDMRLDVSQGMELFGALQRLGVPSKMLYFPDEGHWVLKPQNSQLWNEVVGDWCDRWTKTGKYAEGQ
jgi:dipeptidyl aminopeptidase/acylaminoacyl peptidase